MPICSWRLRSVCFSDPTDEALRAGRGASARGEYLDDDGNLPLRGQLDVHDDGVRWLFERFELRAQHLGGHEVAGAVFEPLFDDFGSTLQVDEGYRRAGALQLLSIGELERRARQDQTSLPRVLSEQLGESREPWGAVAVVQRLSASHLGDIRCWMVVVGVGEGQPQPFGERSGEGGFAGACHSHDDELERMHGFSVHSAP